MSVSKSNPEHASHESAKHGCCGGNHAKVEKVPPDEKGHAVPSAEAKHEPAQQAHSGSCGCGSGKANK